MAPEPSRPAGEVNRNGALVPREMLRLGRGVASETSGEKIYWSRYIPPMFRLEPELIREFKATASHRRLRIADRDEVSSHTYGELAPETNESR